ncbi:MAG: hypothetical protein QOK37_2948 [Thermoanaerobaculia bacterium]|jgi:hypothetical protein|nr:hypothetical protein [Thermoanaerobaculia bacterium]
MPHKGFFTQGLAILMRSTPSVEELSEILAPLAPKKRIVPVGSWPFSGPSILVPYRAGVNGLVDVNIVDHVWPDAMGDTTKDVDVFGAWAMGHFGPFAYPGSLSRAKQQAWLWEEAATCADRHTAFVRIRSSYVFGARDDSPIMPSDYEPLDELTFITEVTALLLTLPGALCYFDPNGERLLPPAEVASLLARGRTTGPVPLELWVNIRLFDLGGDPNWTLMDTVGMQQLDAPDHEACFRRGAFDPKGVDNFLFNAALYVFENGPVIRDGDTMDGPGGIRWQGASFENGLSDPPREVIRWFPQDGTPRLEHLTTREKSGS